jgi:hypothetical protein
LIQWAGEVVLSGSFCVFRATFIDGASQDNKTADFYARAAWRTLSEIWGNDSAHSFILGFALFWPVVGIDDATKILLKNGLGNYTPKMDVFILADGN